MAKDAVNKVYLDKVAFDNAQNQYIANGKRKVREKYVYDENNTSKYRENLRKHLSASFKNNLTLKSLIRKEIYLMLWFNSTIFSILVENVA